MVAVLVGDDLLDRHAVVRRIARHDDLLALEEITPVCLCRLTDALHLGEGRDVQGDLRDLLAVEESRDELCPALVDALVPGIRVGDEDLHLLAARGGVDASV